MKPLLTRRYLAENVEQAIRDAITQGKFGEFLPGERRLSELLGVSRPTLRLALGNLARLGVIKVVKGKRTRVSADLAPADAQPSEKSTRVVMVAPYELNDITPDSLMKVDLVRAKLEEAGSPMEFRTCKWIGKPGQEANLRNFTKHEKPAAWVLFNCHPETQRWFAAQGLPAVVMGLPDTESGLPGIDACHPEAVSHAMARLRKIGHAPEKIAFLNSDLQMPAVEGMDRAFLAAGGLPENIFRHPVEDEAFRAAIIEQSERIFTKGGFTAVIADWAHTGLFFLTYNAIVKGRPIHRELSMVCIFDDAAVNMITPEIARYERSNDRYASAVVRLTLQAVKGVSAKRKCLRVFPNLIPGDTLFPPVR